MVTLFIHDSMHRINFTGNRLGRLTVNSDDSAYGEWEKGKNCF